MATDRKQLKTTIRRKVRERLLDAAPSEVEGTIRQVLAESLAGAVEREGVVLLVDRVVSSLDLAASESLIGGQIISRSEQYAEATYASYENNVMAREIDEGVILGRRVLEDGNNCEDCIAWASEEFRPLDEIEEISTSICGSRCRCEIEFSTGDDTFKTSDLFQGVISGQERYGGDVELQ